MPRRARSAAGGVVYHVLNRANARATLFHKDADYAAFHRVQAEAHARCPGVRLLAWCVMPNHWHFVLWPSADGELSRFAGWLGHTHTQRYHAHYHTTGTGHVYQGRFKSFPVQTDRHVLLACRYVERNPVRAGLAGRARDWPWSSAGVRADHGDAGLRKLLLPEDLWPVPRPPDWDDWVDRPESAAELEALRRSVTRGCPLGTEAWAAEAAARLGLQSTLRPRGRPRVREPSAAGDQKGSRPL